ncbi:hypothetical protein HON01_07900, partial [Candidatus Woesearchaeota archaeon]|nr:hypothetical protein [Candidatus Woesearchaeota archaeon]
EFKSYCKPVVEVLKNSKNICYNKDSTTENWMITPDETIVLIDTEDKGIVPYALDLASFLNLDEPFVDFEERFDYVQLYIDTVNNICDSEKRPDRKINDKELFLEEYCNAVIYRSITNSSSLSLKNESRAAFNMRTTGIQMIDYMKENNMIKKVDEENYNKIKEQLEDWINNSAKQE